MARPLRIEYPGAVYHVIVRGNGGDAIVKTDADRSRFVDTLAQSTRLFSVRLHAYVLMNNHFHLLAETPRGNISEYMRRFNITYTAYFNRVHKRRGHVYQGRFKSVLVDREEYLSVVSRYIHLNPVRTKAMGQREMSERIEHVFSYPWSSLRGYVGVRERKDFVVYGEVLAEYGGDTLTGRRQYRRRILGEVGKRTELPGRVAEQAVLGKEEFVAWVRRSFLGSPRDRERPEVGRLLRKISAEDVLEVIGEEFGLEADEICGSRGWLRWTAMECLSGYGGLSGREIGDLMGVDYTTVSLGRKKLRERRRKDRELEKQLGRIEGRLERERKSIIEI